MSFEDDIKAEFEAPKPTADLTVKLNGNLHTFRFTRMPSDEWLQACDMFPARPGIQFDLRFGYNLRALMPVVAARTAKRVEGDTLVDLTPDQWTNMFKALAGGIVGKFGDVIFKLNEYDAMEEVAALKKALEGASGLNFGLLPDSESPTDESPAGNPEK